MDAADLGFLLQLVLVSLLALLLTALLRRPRLRVDASLRGSTREGTLYVVLTHPKGWAARGVRVDVHWRRGRTRSARVTRQLDTTRAGDALRLEVEDLHTLLPADDRLGWSDLVVTARAWNALPARVRLPVAPREAQTDAPGGGGAGRAAGPAAAPVRYASARDLPCPERADGRHDYEERPFENDGVTERWRVCRACRHAVREPLTREEEEIQQRVRAARADRLRRQMEEEFARMDAEAQARARAEERARRARAERPPPREADEYPVELAFFVLELDAATARWEDVLSAHRRLALAHHPDRHAKASADVRAAAERRMQEINAARDRLREHFEARA